MDTRLTQRNRLNQLENPNKTRCQSPMTLGLSTKNDTLCFFCRLYYK